MAMRVSWTRLAARVRIKVDSSGGNLYVISLRDTNPATAKAIVAALVNLFVNTGTDTKQRDSTEAGTFIDAFKSSVRVGDRVIISVYQYGGVAHYHLRREGEPMAEVYDEQNMPQLLFLSAGAVIHSVGTNLICGNGRDDLAVGENLNR